MTLRQVKYQPEQARTYLGSPSVVRLPDGALLVTHDYFGPGCPRNHEAEECLTSVYRSEDDGQSWVNITHIMNCYWSTLFVHQGAVYILGASQQYGSIHIRRSADGGFTWTHPSEPGHGLLFKGGAYRVPPNYLCPPVPVLAHAGRIYKAYEDCDPMVFGPGFQACVISAPADADLLDSASWTMTNRIPFDPAWLPAEWGALRVPGWREGNMVADPEGGLWAILAFEAAPFLPDKAARVRISDDGRRASFDPATGFFDFPGGKAKFTIRRDPVTGLYFSIVNPIADPDLLARMAAGPGGIGTWVHRSYPMRQRNVAALTVSTDLWSWRVVRPIVQDDSGLAPEDLIRLTGFQYVDWQFDGADLIYVVRVADRGSVTFHDSDQVQYSVLKSFRKLI